MKKNGEDIPEKYYTTAIERKVFDRHFDAHRILVGPCYRGHLRRCHEEFIGKMFLII